MRIRQTLDDDASADNESRTKVVEEKQPRDGRFVVEPFDLKLKDGISYDNIKDLLYPSDLDTLKYRG